MIEFCSTKRMLVSIGAFLGISVLVIYWENSITQDYDNYAHRSVKYETKGDQTVTSSHVQSLSLANACGDGEPFEVLKECVPCSEFELKAATKEYCIASGYYDRLNCTSTGKIAARPCTRVLGVEQRKFNLFTLVMAVLSVVFTSLSVWRRDILDRKAYARIQAQLADGAIV